MHLKTCLLRIRDYVLQAVAETLGLSCDEFLITKTFIKQTPTEMGKKIAKVIKSYLQNHMMEVLTVHRDGKFSLI